MYHVSTINSTDVILCVIEEPQCTVKPACSVALIKCQPANSTTFFCPDPLTPEEIYPILCHTGYSVDFGSPDGGTLSGLHCIWYFGKSQDCMRLQRPDVTKRFRFCGYAVKIITWTITLRNFADQYVFEQLFKLHCFQSTTYFVLLQNGLFGEKTNSIFFFLLASRHRHFSVIVAGVGRFHSK